jgi:hypothetical protein
MLCRCQSQRGEALVDEAPNVDGHLDGALGVRGLVRLGRDAPGQRGRVARAEEMLVQEHGDGLDQVKRRVERQGVLAEVG